MKELFVYAEVADNAVTDLSLQCLAVGRQLARAAGARLSCLVLGSGVGHTAGELLARGCDAVYLVEDPRLEHYLTTPYCSAAEELLKDKSPQIFLLPASTAGNDLAAALAARLKYGCILDCQEVRNQEGAALFYRHEFERRVLSCWKGDSERSVIATLKDGAAAAEEAVPGRAGEVVSVPLRADVPATSRVLRRDVAHKSVNIKDARVVVTGGAGVGTREHFHLIEELAAALKAEVGATRAAVDAGWASPERQIGQTGVTVRPDLYVACGVSGAVQHRVGMTDSRKIVAINTDPAAPIFRFAHYRLVGDLKLVIPKLLDVLKQG